MLFLENVSELSVAQGCEETHYYKKINTLFFYRVISSALSPYRKCMGYGLTIVHIFSITDSLSVHAKKKYMAMVIEVPIRVRIRY